MACVIHVVKESLLRRVDAINLGIIELHPEGLEAIRKLTDIQKKQIPNAGDRVSGVMT